MPEFEHSADRKQVLNNLRFLNGGYCVQAEFVTGRRTARLRKFHAVFVHFTHPVHGEALIDAGYSSRFLKATHRIPHFAYRLVTPMGMRQDLSDEKLYEDNAIDRNQINHVFVSHFHGDHIGGLNYFDQSEFVYRSDSLNNLRSNSMVGQLKRGFLNELVPRDIENRSIKITESDWQTDLLSGFNAIDFWGDGSLLIVDLPGHFEGHSGYLLNSVSGPVFYLVDATWDVELMIAQRRLPWPGRLIQHDWKIYQMTQRKLGAFQKERPDIAMLACHCPRTQTYIASGNTHRQGSDDANDLRH